ncbi:MAG: hypothetical protein ABL871_03850 [Terricaulis sp.]
MTAEQPSKGAVDRGGRPELPTVTADALTTIRALVAERGFWPAASICERLSWTPGQLESLSKRNRRLRKLKRDTDALAEAKLAEQLLSRALSGTDRQALVMALKRIGWAGSREPGGHKGALPDLPENARELLGLPEQADADEFEAMTQ